MAHNLQSFANNRLNTNRATIDSKGRPANSFVLGVNSNCNPSQSNTKSVNQMSTTIPAINMVSNNLVPKNECSCDPEFVDFCKMHTISHTDCQTTRHVCCQLCSTSADFKSIQWHLQSEKHRKSHQQLMEYVLLLSIPEYSPSHAIRITDLLIHNYKNVFMSSSEYERRVQVVEQINQLIKANGLERYSLRIYGSTIGGFALNNSDINLDIVSNNTENGDKNDKKTESEAIVLSKISEIIERTPKGIFDNIRNEFNLKVPKLRFREIRNKFEIEVSLKTEKSYRLSKLLQQYCNLDDRVRVLGVAFREWARIYGFDDQENGLFPAFTFPILVIHYLQRCSPPVLPCLHELLSDNSTATTSANSPKEAPNQSVSHNRDAFDDNEGVEDFFNLSSLNWQITNHKSVGELWLDMLRYYAVQFDTETYVVSIRSTKPIQTRADKHWSTRMLAVEDPTRPSLNLSRSVGSLHLFNVFIEQLRHTFKYFAIPFINVNSNNTSHRRPLFTEKDFQILVNQNHHYDNIEVNDLMTQINNIRKDMDNESESKNPNQPLKGSDDSDSEDENRKKENFFLRVNRLLKTFGIWMELLPEIAETTKLIPVSQLSYTFALNRLPFFKRPPKFCRLCRKYGHQQSKCPEQELPPLRALPETLNPFYDSDLNKICYQIYNEKRMDQNDQRIQNDIITDLEEFIRHKIPNAKLSLFGSTKNGFGARNCDLDICLRFEDNATGEGLEFDKIIENVAEVLISHPRLTNILPIVTAKVPIVKFGYIYQRNHCIECDISSYNILGIHNTELLNAYTQLDHRVPVLGFVIKHFAKTCDMGDASRGSLSSYAYTLMTIHYLQQKRIIPVLQEVGLEFKEERIVQHAGVGWDTWYFDDLGALHKHWIPSQNQESVAQLFVGFLRYYSEIFNFEEYVICCRQFSLLKRLEKMWTGSKIAIEDPFNLSHNLGAGVSAQMAVFIKTAFIKGRNLFGVPPSQGLDTNRYRNWTEFFFNRHQLTNGLPPTGRGCRLCGKIGHKQNSCPEKRPKNNKDRPDRNQRNDRPGQDRPGTDRFDRQEKYERNDRLPKTERQDKPLDRVRDKKQNNRRKRN